MSKPQRYPTRERFWRDTVADWQASGRTVRDFCRDRRLNETSFRYWSRELLESDAVKQVVFHEVVQLGHRSILDIRSIIPYAGDYRRPRRSGRPYPQRLPKPPEFDLVSRYSTVWFDGLCYSCDWYTSRDKLLIK